MDRRFVVADSGTTEEVDAADLPEPDRSPLAGSLRLEIVALDPRFAPGEGFQLLVYVNNIEMTRIDRSVVFDGAEYDREVTRTAQAALDTINR
jgi:hypothetical protein